MTLEGKHIDRYHIQRLLGSGGMGDVYLAEDARIGQQVAIKVIRAEVNPYPNDDVARDAVRLFEREARAIVKLDHPNILPLYHYLEEHINNMTFMYLVMPYRQEGSLADWLRRRGKTDLLSPQDVAHLVRQAADALQHAHEHHIIHQDVKPSNFLIRSRKDSPTRPELFLADFGIARLTNASSSISQSVRGTPTYTAPEQWGSEAVPATDQYALAVMAYALLTGRPPFQGEPRKMMYQHLSVEPPPPSSFNPSLSTEIDTVLLHALAKQPEQRFASITAFANAFQHAVQELQVASASTFMKPPDTPLNNGDIRAVLAINAAEALAGTTRTITLPAGRKVTVSVPAGIQDGQIIRLDGQGETSPNGGSTGALILTIIVKQADASLATSDSVVAEHTALAAGGATNAIDQALASNTDASLMPPTEIPLTPSLSSPVTGGSTRQMTLDAWATDPIEKSLTQAAATRVPEGNETTELPHRAETVPPTTGNGITSAQRRSRRRPLLAIALVLLTGLLIAGGTAYADLGVFTSLEKIVFGTSPNGPLTADSANVTITPASTDLKNTFPISAVKGTPDASKQQVSAHILSSTMSAKTQMVNTTGRATTLATHATGTVYIQNFNPSSLTFKAGMVIGPNIYTPKIDLLLDATVTLAAYSNNNYNYAANVPAHIAQLGAIGNIPFGAFFYCTGNACSNSNYPSSGWTAYNQVSFAGGQDPQNYTTVQQSDINNAANALNAHPPDPQQALQSQIHSNERLVGTPQCNPKVTSNHVAGDKATSVTVSVSYTCTGEVYDDVAARSMATQLLQNQAATNLGSGYSLVGNIATTVTQAKLVDAKQGTVALTVAAEGIWAYQFSAAQQQNLTKLIAGHKKQDAQTLLYQQTGVKQADLQLSGGDGNTLPTDPTRITIIVQPVPALQTPTP